MFALNVAAAFKIDRSIWDHWGKKGICHPVVESEPCCGLFIQKKDEIFIPECCRNALFCVSYLTQAQILVTNQMDYGYKLFPSTGSLKNNANE